MSLIKTTVYPLLRCNSRILLGGIDIVLSISISSISISISTSRRCRRRISITTLLLSSGGGGGTGATIPCPCRTVEINNHNGHIITPNPLRNAWIIGHNLVEHGGTNINGGLGLNPGLDKIHR